MTKKISYILYKLIKLFDILFMRLTRRSFLIWFKDFIEEDSYKSIKILNKKINFFTPNYITGWLIDNFYTKEPETIEWINNFKNNNKKIIFWDIGANIGIYSIYAAVKHLNIEIVSFEPSTSNLRILSRNISINNFENKIKINQFPLSNIENKYLLFNESKFMEGLAEHTFGETTDIEGNSFKPVNNYRIFGTSINYLLKNKILEVPSHIKIDVDGIEHLVLEGASEYLNNKEIKSIMIELNEDYVDSYNRVLFIMKKNNFIIKNKSRSSFVDTYLNGSIPKVYNYQFDRNN